MVFLLNCHVFVSLIADVFEPCRCIKLPFRKSPKKPRKCQIFQLKPSLEKSWLLLTNLSFAKNAGAHFFYFREVGFNLLLVTFFCQFENINEAPATLLPKVQCVKNDDTDRFTTKEVLLIKTKWDSYSFCWYESVYFCTPFVYHEQGDAKK